MKEVEKKKKMEHERKPYGNVFAIDQNNLEGEAIRQLELMSEYGELSAEAVFQALRLEEKKKVLRSKIMLANQAKAKNAQISEALYRADPEYVKVVERLNEALYQKELMQNAMYALAQRRDMIDMFSRRQIATNGIQTGSEAARKRVAEKTKDRLNRKGNV